MHAPSLRETAIVAVVAFGHLVGCERRTAPSATAASGDGASPDAAPEPVAVGIPSASVNAVVNPAKLPAYSGPTGSVEGAVLVRGPEAPDVPGIDVHSCTSAMDIYGKLFRAGPARADGLRPLADAVVVATGYSGAYIPERQEGHEVAITPGCGYAQRTIAMTFGQSLDIVNESKLAFAPYLNGVMQPAVMIAPPERRGDAVKLYPPRPGHFMLGDRMQPYVSEAVLVLLQPLHAVTDLAGRYRIDGVPVGKIKVGAQLDALPGGTLVSVDVRPNVVESVDLVLTYAPIDAGAVAGPRSIP